MLADQALASALVPWACPCRFGREQRYSLEELVATGRRSFVYKARDLLMSSKGFEAFVAVKITPPRPAAENDALLARRVNHPNVLQVLDRGSDESGATYVVTEWMDGGTLADVNPPMPPRKAVALISKLARAVQASHLAGVIHCDLKPSNVLFTADFEPKLADFDLAYAAALSDDQSQRGNLAFMSPEQFESAPGCLAPAADVYALGGLLYWLLTARPPHGESAASVLQFHGERSPITPLSVERDLDAMIHKALARSVQDRYQAAASFADDLDSWLKRMPIPWTKPSLTRRARLFARRNPTRLVIAASLLVGASTGAAYAYDRTIGASLRDAQTAKDIATKSEEQVEKLRLTMRTAIKGIATTMNVTKKSDRDIVLSTLFMIEWIRGTFVLNGQSLLELPNEQISALRSLVNEAQNAGTDDHLQSMLERYALVLGLVQTENPAEALTNLDRLEEVWLPRLAQGDCMRVNLSALRQGALLTRAYQDHQPLDTHLASVKDSIEAIADASGSQSLSRVLLHLLDKYQPPAPEAP